MYLAVALSGNDHILPHHLVNAGKSDKLTNIHYDYELKDYSLAARGGNLAKIPPNQVIADFGRGSSV